MWFCKKSAYVISALLSLMAVWGLAGRCMISYDFPDDPERCFSPNGNFYVVRYVSPWNLYFLDYYDREGTAKLFDRNGTLIAAWPAFFGADSGPFWSDSSKAGKDEGRVYFMGDGRESMTALPGASGRSQPERNCNRRVAK